MKVNAAVRTIAFVVLMSSLRLWAQAPNMNPSVPPEKQIPVVKFEFVMPGSVPPHYALTVEAGGAAAYRSDAAPAIGTNSSSDGTAETPYFLKFDLSAATAQRIFDLAKDLNFFRGDFEFHGGRVANMGAKTLTFKDGKQENSFTYNYSQNPQLQQLTTLLQGIAASLEYRRELEQLYRYEKLGIDEKLRQMEIDSERGYLAEIQVDEPILRQIASDTSIMNISRKTARKLLAKIK